MNKYLKNQLYLLYSLNFFRDFNLIFVLLSPFILFSGLTVGDYLITISAFRMTQTFLSIPCGILSDNLNPRRSLQLSSFLFFLSFVFLVPKHLTLFNFIMFNFTSALSATFLLTSSNKHLRSLVSDQEVFLKKYSFKISLRKLGTVISGAIAAVMLSLFSYKGVLYVQLFFGLSVFILSLKFSAPIASSEKSKRVWLFDWKEVWSLMKSTSFFKVLLWLFHFL
jgi:MFS family permease